MLRLQGTILYHYYSGRAWLLHARMQW